MGTAQTKVRANDEQEQLQGISEFRSAWCSGSETVICRLVSEDSGLRIDKSLVSHSSGWGGAPLGICVTL